MLMTVLEYRDFCVKFQRCRVGLRPEARSKWKLLSSCYKTMVAGPSHEEGGNQIARQAWHISHTSKIKSNVVL